MRSAFADPLFRDCNLTVELSVIFASTRVAGHDYNLHSRIDFPEKS
jgi:hypothetical protein